MASCRGEQIVSGVEGAEAGIITAVGRTSIGGWNNLYARYFGQNFLLQGPQLDGLASEQS